MWKINKNIAFRVIDGEIFIVTSFDKTLHNLNPLATFIFQQIEKKKTQSDIVSEICKEYEVEKDIVEKDLEEFLKKLKEKNILQ